MTRAALRALLLDALRLWNVPGTVEWDGALLRLPGGATLRPAEPPMNWVLAAGGPERACLSLPDALSILRRHMAPDLPPAGLRLPPPLPALDGTAQPDGDRMPVFLVSGALGAGKTTAIAHLLGDPAMAGTALLVNEYGPGLDDKLLGGTSSPVATPGATPMATLAAACLCCAPPGAFAESLGALLARHDAGETPFTRVLVEFSGVADPSPAIVALRTLPTLAARFRLAACAVLVDARNGFAPLLEGQEAAAQIALADRVAFTRTDLVPVPDALRNAVEAANPGVPTIDVAHGALPASWLLAPARTAPRAPPPVPVVHANGLGASTVPVPPLSRATLLRFLSALCELAGPRLLRTKGLVAETGRDGPLLIQTVGPVLEYPEPRDAWPEGARSALTVIGRDIPPLFPARLLEAVQEEAREDA